MNQPKVSHPFFLLTAEQSRRLDETTIDKFGIDGFTLMEIAGSKTAGAILEDLKEEETGLFFCGKGNNAGDALVVARWLVQHQIHCTIVFLSGTDSLSPDCDKNLSLLKKIQQEDQRASQYISILSWDEFDKSTRADFIIDGMLGTGLDSDVRSPYKEASDWINNRPSATVYAVDIPTGLHADSGKPLGVAVKADRTFTYGTQKTGFYLNDGPGYTGSVLLCELPFPNYLKQSDTFLIDEQWAGIPKISRGSHKYDKGVVYIVAGSEGLTGAAILSAKSAWAEGIGAVVVVCPRGILEIFENNLPQIIKKPVGRRDDYFFKPEHLADVVDVITEKDGSVIVGPGLGRRNETQKFTSDLLRQNSRNFVIDADALWALAQNGEWQKPPEADWILTPHPGELSRLCQEPGVTHDDLQRLDSVRTVAAGKRMTVLSKGSPGIVGTSGGLCYITPYDCNSFNRAGFGDVLAGKIGAYRAAGYPSDISCVLGLLSGKRSADNITHKPLEPLDLT